MSQNCSFFTHDILIFLFPRLILIAEKDTVYLKFPTPLINRLEKHFVLTSSVLEDWQKDLLEQFEVWISHFCDTKYNFIVHTDNISDSNASYSFRGRRFTRGDAFVGYQKDTPAAVVFQASNFLRRLREEDDEDIIHRKSEVLARAGILEKIPLSVLRDREGITEHWRDAVRLM